jgi:hypothetical protein
MLNPLVFIQALGGLLAAGLNVQQMLAMALIGAGVALAAGYGSYYRAQRAQLKSAALGTDTSRAKARLTLSMVGVLLLALGLVFGGIIWRALAQ